VAKPKRSARKKSEPKLTRVAFKVSRLMEFCSERELQNQTGHSLYDWPLVVGKEVMDNALDAAEEAEVAPVIEVIVDLGSIIIQDNAGGIDSETVESILDYSIRVSSREAYVSPTRGAQGNALKTILAMGYVLDRKLGSDAAGVTIIEARGIAHRIEVRVDHVNNQPKIIHTTAESPVTVGTKLTIKWPPQDDLSKYAEDRFKQLIASYVWFNPHLTLRGVWFGQEFINVRATNPSWEKWGPRNPTSPHWYDETRLQRYLAAHVARDRDLGQHRTVREFIAEFRGLSATTVQRKVLAEIERKLKDYGLQKVIPDDNLLGEVYEEFHRSKELREKFEEMASQFEESKIKVPKNLKNQVRAKLKQHPELRWDDAIQIVLDGTQLDHVRAKKQKAKKKSGDFTNADEGEGDAS
jgi:DNA topoisomerase VI subunit B